MLGKWHTWYLGGADSEFKLTFSNFNLKMHFWVNLCQKSQSYPFWLKVDTYAILEKLIFEILTRNLFLGKLGSKMSKLSILPENWHAWYFARADSKSPVRFLKFRPQNPFLGKFEPKKHSLFILIWDLAAVFGQTASSDFIL